MRNDKDSKIILTQNNNNNNRKQYYHIYYYYYMCTCKRVDTSIQIQI